MTRPTFKSSAICLIALALLAQIASAQTVCRLRVDVRFFWLDEWPLPELTKLSPDPMQARITYDTISQKAGVAYWQDTAKGKYSVICSVKDDHPDYFILWTNAPAAYTSVWVFQADRTGCVVAPNPVFQTSQTGGGVEQTNRLAFKKTLQFLLQTGKTVAVPVQSHCITIDSFISNLESSHLSNWRQQAHQQPSSALGSEAPPDARSAVSRPNQEKANAGLPSSAQKFAIHSTGKSGDSCWMTLRNGKFEYLVSQSGRDPFPNKHGLISSLIRGKPSCLWPGQTVEAIINGDGLFVFEPNPKPNPKKKGTDKYKILHYQIEQVTDIGDVNQ